MVEIGDVQGWMVIETEVDHDKPVRLTKNQRLKLGLTTKRNESV